MSVDVGLNGKVRSTLTHTYQGHTHALAYKYMVMSQQHGNNLRKNWVTGVVPGKSNAPPPPLLNSFKYCYI